MYVYEFVCIKNKMKDLMKGLIFKKEISMKNRMSAHRLRNCLRANWEDN